MKAKIQVTKNAMYKHVTGVWFVKAKSIKGLVIKDPHGAITAHVCANTITLPEGVLSPTKESYDLFVDAMKAVIADKSFNTVLIFFFVETKNLCCDLPLAAIYPNMCILAKICRSILLMWREHSLN